MGFPFAAPLTAAWLAPGPQELQSAVQEMQVRLGRAELVQVALGRVHAAWGEALATDRLADPCKDPLVSSWVARSRALGSAYRDEVQASRAQLERLEYLWSSPTVQPILDAEQRTLAAHLRERTAEQVRAWAEAAAWQSSLIEPKAKKCAHELVPTDGLSYVGPDAALPKTGVAILGTGEGVLCPMNVPASGVVLAPDGLACWSSRSCDCTPIEVAPAAVLGPP